MSEKSNFVSKLPDAEFVILDNGLGESGTVTNVIAGLLDKYASGSKGKIFTAAIAASGYTDDPKGLSYFYEQNSSAIDEYFSYIKLESLAEAIGGDVEDKVSDGLITVVRKNTPAFVAGMGAMGVLMLVAKLSRGRK